MPNSDSFTVPAITRPAETLFELAAQINAEHEAGKYATRQGLEHFRNAGECLIKAKAKCGHGKWLKWLETNIKFGVRRADRYMAFAKLDVTSNLEDMEDHWRIICGNASSSDADSDSQPKTPTKQTALAIPDEISGTLQEALVDLDDQERYLAETWKRLEEEAASNGNYEEAARCQDKYVEAIESPDGCAPPDDDDEADKPHVHVAQNSGEHEWYTPPTYLEAARKVIGKFDLDPATSDVAQQAVQAKKFYTKETDGLAQTWRGRVWMNPPYAGGLVDQFVAKLSQHYQEGDVTSAIVLVNNATETKWFRQCAELASAICFPTGRIRFLDPEGNPGAPLQGQALIYLGDNPNEFMAAFAQFGFCALMPATARSDS